MTKVIILGGAQGAEPEKKKIEFVTYISVTDMEFVKPCLLPSDYKNIELIAKDMYDSEYDYMFAYDSDRSLGILYLGKFNDGIV